MRTMLLAVLWLVAGLAAAMPVLTPGSCPEALSPFLADADCDGYSFVDEVSQGTHPLSRYSHFDSDTDGDDCLDGMEATPSNVHPLRMVLNGAYGLALAPHTQDHQRPAVLGACALVLSPAWVQGFTAAAADGFVWDAVCTSQESRSVAVDCRTVYRGEQWPGQSTSLARDTYGYRHVDTLLGRVLLPCSQNPVEDRDMDALPEVYLCEYDALGREYPQTRTRFVDEEDCQEDCLGAAVMDLVAFLQDSDGDGYATMMELDVGSNPKSLESTPQSDDNGDGHSNGQESVRDAYLDGTYGVDYAHHTVPVEVRQGDAWVWDGVCSIDLEGYDGCKRMADSAGMPSLLDGYGWKNLGPVAGGPFDVLWPCGVEDRDNDGLPVLVICDAELHVLGVVVGPEAARVGDPDDEEPLDVPGAVEPHWRDFVVDCTRGGSHPDDERAWPDGDADGDGLPNSEEPSCWAGNGAHGVSFPPDLVTWAYADEDFVYYWDGICSWGNAGYGEPAASCWRESVNRGDHVGTAFDGYGYKRVAHSLALPVVVEDVPCPEAPALADGDGDGLFVVEAKRCDLTVGVAGVYDFQETGEAWSFGDPDDGDPAPDALAIAGQLVDFLLDAVQDFDDLDGDGDFNQEEVLCGGHPAHAGSRCGTDDDGDGTPNDEEHGLGPLVFGFLCTGAYGVVAVPECGGYAPATQCRTVQSEFACASPGPRIAVWDALCLPAAMGEYGDCKTTSNHAEDPLGYDGDFAGDGYGWRYVGEVPEVGTVSVFVAEACGTADGDGDGVPRVEVCVVEYEVGQGGVEEVGSSPLVVVGDPDDGDPDDPIASQEVPDVVGLVAGLVEDNNPTPLVLHLVNMALQEADAVWNATLTIQEVEELVLGLVGEAVAGLDVLGDLAREVESLRGLVDEVVSQYDSENHEGIVACIDARVAAGVAQLHAAVDAMQEDPVFGVGQVIQWQPPNVLACQSPTTLLLNATVAVYHVLGVVADHGVDALARAEELGPVRMVLEEYEAAVRMVRPVVEPPVTATANETILLASALLDSTAGLAKPRPPSTESEDAPRASVVLPWALVALVILVAVVRR